MFSILLKSNPSEEAALIKRAQNGSADAFTRIVERYQVPVYNICYRYVKEPDAEDMAQETFVRAFVNLSSFDLQKPVLPWLMTIARRLCIDRLRRQKTASISDTDQETLRDFNPNAEESVVSREEIALLEQGLNNLPEGQREAIAMHHLDGMAYKNIADVLDVPIGTVMTWLHRGRTTLKKLLGRESETSMGKTGTKGSEQ